MNETLPISIPKIAAMLKEHCHTHIMPLYKNLTKSQIHQKGQKDIVTDADKNMEKNLSQNLQQILKNSQILGEETYATNPETAKALETNEYVWVIDPLDGTRNFIKQKEEFCSMLALVKNGKTIAAWIYTPLKDEMIMADISSKTQDINGNPITIKTMENTNPENIIGQINFGMFQENNKEELIKIAENKYKNLDKVFCVGYDFSGMCLSRRHFSTYRHLWWWDHIPGSFLLQQAGGIVKQIGNEAYSPIKPAKQLIVAVNDKIANDITSFMCKANPELSAT